MHITNKVNGDQLSAAEWNSLAADVNSLMDGNGVTGGSTTHVNMTNKWTSDTTKGNLNIETTAEDQVTDSAGKVKGGKINIESYSDLQIKPGDDITLYSHHREDPEELSVKVLNGAEISATDQEEIEEYPVDLQLNTSNIILTTKDKNITISEKNKARAAAGKDASADKSNILNVEVKTGVKAKKATAKNGQYGYLKLRGQAIDIRCEDHGGIALQPKGYDSDGNMNKIKFEHGGGDGLEFGTFNTEKSSLFTNEYRFNKDGYIYLATREVEDSNKTDDTGIFDNTPSGKTATNAKKYVKQSDDFYDVLDHANNPSCKWADLITVGNALSTHVRKACKYYVIKVDSTTGAGSFNTNGTRQGESVLGIIADGITTSPLGLTAEDIESLPYVTNTNLGVSGITPTRFAYESDLNKDINFVHALDDIKSGGCMFTKVGDDVYAIIKQAYAHDVDDSVIRTSYGSVLLGDICKLVDYMKSKKQGPWEA